jgi:hypothetical protein
MTEQTDIPQWALKRAEKLARAEASGFYSRDSHRALARYIAQHEQPPIDPLLKEAQKIGVAYCSDPETQRKYIAGGFDNTATMRALVAALRRGIEIGRGE